MAKETKKYDEDYLNGLIKKAKKSLEGVDVDSFMSELRDDFSDKEVAEKLSKEVTSHIIEQIKYNMDAVTVKCRNLMVGDWITNRNGFPMQITNVGEDYAYATFAGNEGDPWEFDDKDDQPQPIPLTPEILEKNDWYWGLTSNEEDIVSCVGGAYDEHWVYDEGAGEISLIFPKDTDGGELRIDDQRFNRHLEFIWCDTLYVHELQNALRLCGLDEIADNFKV